MILYPDYDHAILNVSTTLLAYYGIKSKYPAVKVLEEALDMHPDHIIYIVLDGMGMNLLHTHLSKDDFLMKHLKDTVTSVFPPTTVAATNTILSGLPPISTGYLGWIQYFKKEDTNLAVFLNQDYYEPDRAFHHVLRDQYLSYPTLGEQIKKVHPSVDTYELFPNFRPNGYHAFADQVDEVITITQTKEKSFTYIYWTDPDLTEHDFGVDHEVTKDVLMDLNAEVERLYQNVHSKTLIAMIADHGLINVEHIDIRANEALMSCLKRLPSMEPRAANFFVKKGFKDRFKALFELSYQTDFMLLSKKEFLASNLLGKGKKHPMIKQFLGDFIAISVGHAMFDFLPDNQFIASHAGLTKAEMEVPLIIMTR